MVSFKISKIGTRYTPKLSSGRVQAGNPQSFSPTENGSQKITQLSNGPQHGGGPAAGGGKFGTHAGSTPKLSLPSKRSCSNLVDGASCTSKKKRGEAIQAGEDGDFVGNSLTSTPVSGNQSQDREASFAVNLFKFGFSLSKPTEKTKEAPSGYEVMQNSYPYDRTTENFLRALDGGWLPGDLLDDLPCTYIDGCVVCELRDYRRRTTPAHDTNMFSEKDMSMEWTPKVTRLLLQPSTETIVKDVAAMADKSWTYSDFLEAEAKILKFVQPPLCLDPGVAVAKKAYTENFNKRKFNIGCPALRRYRMPKDASADRRFRIAASAKIFSKKGMLHKSLDKIGDKGSDSAGSYTPHEIAQDSFPLLPLDGETTMNAAIPGQILSGLPESSTISQALPTQVNMNHSGPLRGALSLPIQPLQGPYSPSSGILGTVSTVTSANGDLNVVPKSHPSKRESNDLAAGGREDFKKQKLEQLRLHHQQPMMPLRNDKGQQDQQFQEQSPDLLKQRQMLLNQLYQDQVTRADASGFFPADQDHLDIKTTGLDGTKLARGIEQNQEEVDKYHQEWSKDSLELGDGSLSRDQLQQSNVLNESPQIPQPPLGSHPGMVVPGQGQSPYWQTGQGFDFKTGLKVERDTVLDEFPQRKPVPTPVSQQALPTQLQGAMKGPLSGSAMGMQSGIPLSLQTISPQPGNTPKSPAQMVASSFPSGNSGQPDSMLLSPPYAVLNSQSLRRPSLPKMQSVASPSQSNSVASPLLNSPSTGSAPMSTSIVKNEGMTQPGITGPQGLYQRKLSIDSRTTVQPSQLALLDIIHRMKMLSAKEPAAGSADKDLPPPNRTQPSFQLVAHALADSGTDDPPEAKGRRSMASSLVGGNVNARKSRTLRFERTKLIPQGRGFNPRNVQSHTYLNLCGQVQDTMVEAVIHVSDFENEGQQLPASQCVLPPLANPEKADLFATQYAALMLKEGWELTEDNVQPAPPRGTTAMTNAATNARPMPAGATTLGNTMTHPGSSPRVLMNQQHMAVVPGTGISPLNQMQPPSPNAAAAARMPPPANSNRQILPNHMGQQVAGKPMQMDVAVSPLAAVQQQQQHQLHQQHPQHLQLQQHPNQRQQQLIANQQLVAQLGAQGGNPQMNQMTQMTQMTQLQYLRQHQSMLQRKMVLPNNMNNLAVGLNGGSNIGSINGVGLPVTGGAQGMPSVSGLGSMAGMANSIGGMSALANMGQLTAMSNMGQAGGVVNMISPQLRSGLMNGTQAGMAGKRLPAGRGRATGTGSPVRSAMDSLPMAGANRMLGNPGVPMMSQQLARNGLQTLQRPPVAGMTIPKVGTPVIGTGISPQGYYVNQQQKNAQQIPGGLGSLVGVPPSTQVSTQGLGSVVGLNSAAMDLQSVPRTTAPGQGQVRRPMMNPSQSGQPGQQSQ